MMELTFGSSGPTGLDSPKEKESLGLILPGTDQQHNGDGEDPMPNFPPEIIAHIFRNLDVKSLGKCRLVCKSWNSEVCRQLKGRTVYQLRPEDVLSFCFRKKGAPKLDISSTVQDIDEIYLTVSEPLSSYVKLVLAQHWTLFPPFVTRLTILKTEWQQPKSRAKDCAWIIKKYEHLLTHLTVTCKKDLEFVADCLETNLKFPKLQHLEIDNGLLSNVCPIEPYDWMECYRLAIIMPDIIRSAPKLETLKCDGCCDLVPTSFAPYPLDFRRLRHLEIVFKSKIFWRIVDAVPTIPLTTMILHCRMEKSTTCPLLCCALRVFAKTLKHLEVKYLKSFPPECKYEDIPTFPQLKYLSVNCEFKLGEKWLRKMPQLRSLRVRKFNLNSFPQRGTRRKGRTRKGMGGEHYYEFLLEQTSFPTVEEIEAQTIKFVEGDIQRRTRLLLTLKQVFPNVKFWKVEEARGNKALDKLVNHTDTEKELELVRLDNLQAVANRLEGVTGSCCIV